MGKASVLLLASSTAAVLAAFLLWYKSKKVAKRAILAAPPKIRRNLSLAELRNVSPDPEDAGLRRIMTLGELAANVDQIDETIPLKDLTIGLMHSQIGDVDGVSIVIDQICQSLMEHAGLSASSFVFCCGKCAGEPSKYPRVWSGDALWHKDAVTMTLNQPDVYENPSPSPELKKLVEDRILDARRVIRQFFEESRCDILIVHNSCHPVNLVMSVALSREVAARKSVGRRVPVVLLWWHDSHLERARYSHPSPYLSRFLLEGVPGPHVDGIIFINKGQWPLAREYFAQLSRVASTLDDPGLMMDEPVAMNPLSPSFPDPLAPDSTLLEKLESAHVVCPNTSDIPNNWPALFDPTQDPTARHFSPSLDQFNSDFLAEIGVLDALADRPLEEAVLVLQHTRIVRRKRIDHAIDFCFALAQQFYREDDDRMVFLIVSGNAGDEPGDIVGDLERHYTEQQQRHPHLQVRLVLAGSRIRSHRETVDGVKYFGFDEVPAVIAYFGGIGSYFSEVEGFGNNLLELLSQGVPPVAREYPVYASDIKPLGFKVPTTLDGTMTQELIEEAHRLLTDVPHRELVVKTNLAILREHLSHRTITDRIGVLRKALTEA